MPACPLRGRYQGAGSTGRRNTGARLESRKANSVLIVSASRAARACRSPGIARRMGGANGSRECAPDDKLRDTHQFEFAEMMGFRKGLNPSYEPRYPALRSCFVSRASEISRSGRDKTTRRANHQNPVQTSARKYFAFAVGQITDLTSPVSPDERGGSRSSRTCGGMRWTRELRLTSVT
jgi:hypothetical protein